MPQEVTSNRVRIAHFREEEKLDHPLLEYPDYVKSSMMEYMKNGIYFFVGQIIYAHFFDKNNRKSYMEYVRDGLLISPVVSTWHLVDSNDSAIGAYSQYYVVDTNPIPDFVEFAEKCIADMSEYHPILIHHDPDLLFHESEVIKHFDPNLTLYNKHKSIIEAVINSYVDQYVLKNGIDEKEAELNKKWREEHPDEQNNS